MSNDTCACGGHPININITTNNPGQLAANIATVVQCSFFAGAFICHFCGVTFDLTRAVKWIKGSGNEQDRQAGAEAIREGGPGMRSAVATAGGHLDPGPENRAQEMVQRTD